MIWAWKRQAYTDADGSTETRFYDDSGKYDVLCKSKSVKSG